MKFNIGLPMLVLMAVCFSYAADLKVEQIQRAIENNGAQWTATENKITRLSPEARTFLTGAIPIDSDDILPENILALPQAAALPDSFDWRDADGDWVTPVRDQAQCGSCWAFAALGQMEAWWKIQNGDAEENIDLSEQFLLSCSDAGNCEQGGWAWRSLDFIKQNSIALEADLPYQAKSNIPCSNTKAGWEERSLTIPGWGFITMDEAEVENIKNAVFRHPLSVNFEVFQDFNSYGKGVYEHVIGESTGWHAVVIVGWNDREESWIVKNSWGPDWGEKGYFRIKWGNSNMGRYSAFIWDEIKDSFLFPSVGQLELTLTYGDTGSAEFDLGNYGDASLQFYVNQQVASHSEPAWLRLENSAGHLNPSEQETVRLFFETRDLVPGDYKRTLKIISNDMNAADVEVSVVLTVEPPEHDLKMESLKLPHQGFTLLSWTDMGCIIKNIGTQTMSDFEVTCRIVQDDYVLMADTSHVEQLSAQQSLLVEFLPFRPMLTGELQFDVGIINAQDDYNDFNNDLFENAVVSNLVEGFESPKDRWDLQGGWAFTDQLNGHDGGFSAHVFGGEFPYAENMDAVMTFVAGFELADVDTLFATFWTRYVMADSNDVCYVEVSGDSSNWDMRDLFTGVQPAWSRHVIDLTDVAQSGAAKAWLRFGFHSDENGGSIGALVDDLEIFTETIKIEEESNLETRVSNAVELPSTFQLRQNYPNPFNPSTLLAYTLPQEAFVVLSIFDLKGRLVSELLRAHQNAGGHEFIWNAAGQSSGVYIYVLDIQTNTGERFVAHRKMGFIK
jgi:C1A family cysteine protease